VRNKYRDSGVRVQGSLIEHGSLLLECGALLVECGALVIECGTLLSATCMPKTLLCAIQRLFAQSTGLF